MVPLSFLPIQNRGEQEEKGRERVRAAPEQDACFHGRRHGQLLDFLDELLYFLRLHHASRRVMEVISSIRAVLTGWPVFSSVSPMVMTGSVTDLSGSAGG